MYSTSDIRKNLKIEIDGVPYMVVDFQFVKPGKGNAFTRTRLKNMMTGAVIDRTYKTGEKLKRAQLEEIAAVKGITQKLAETVKHVLSQASTSSA